MEDRSRRGPQEFADIVPGRTTEVYLDLTERRTESERADALQPALVMLQGDLPGHVFRLPIGRQVIGRRADCHIRLREKAVSGQHAEIVRTDAGVSVSDLQSTNGTVVNGRRIRNPVFLAQGNLLKLGKSVFRYVDSLLDVELTESLHARASTDALTGLWNRTHFLARAPYVIDGASAAHPVTLIVIVLERFSPDEVLRTVARILHESCDEPGGQIARVGDDSFAVLAHLEVDSAVQAIRAALLAAGIPSSITVATTTRPTESPESLLGKN
ncbi:MAG TPA: FHA domain-containing protein [Thermoanaerobaculia bacterium]|nr:FHA domain-containing protein [Thermoanaerobaculia bacterium]